MARMIKDTAAYVVSPQFMESQIMQDTKRDLERQARIDEAWLEMKMEEFAKGFGLNYTAKQAAEPTTAEREPKPRYSPRADKSIEIPKGMKRCCHCREIKPLEAFAHDNRRPDGRYCMCRPCHKQSRIEYELARKQKKLETMKANQL